MLDPLRRGEAASGSTEAGTAPGITVAGVALGTGVSKTALGTASLWVVSPWPSGDRRLRPLAGATFAAIGNTSSSISHDGLRWGF